MKKTLVLSLVLVMLLALTGCDSTDYKDASALYDAGNYAEAAAMFEALGDYEDSAIRAMDSKYQQAAALQAAGSYLEAADMFDALTGFSDSANKADENRYLYAESLFAAGSYAEAAAIYESISSYPGAADRLAAAQKEMMYVTYADLFAALENGVWFYEDTSVNAVNVLSFTRENANLKDVWYDGNGAHVSADIPCAYTVDDMNITITLQDQTQMVIPYVMDGTNVIFSGEYFTAQQVEEALQGYWGLLKLNYNMITGFAYGEYIYYFNNGSVEFESAVEAYGYDDGTYYYYGPDYGTYTIGTDGLVVDASNNWQFGFLISEGEVVMCRCGDICSRYSGFKGLEGYDFG